MNILTKILETVDPTIFKIGPFEVRWYGIMYLIGFIIGTAILKKLSSEKFINLSKKKIDSLVSYQLVGMIVGCRLAYCFIYDTSFNLFKDPLQLIKIWEGGLSFHGGLVGMITASLLFAHINKLNFFNLADCVTIAGVQGLFFGRIGNFLNRELYGRITDSSLGIVFPGAGSYPRYPSQLFESFGEGLLIFLILFSLRKWLLPKYGLSLSLFILLYGVIRFFLEYFREPDVQLGFVFRSFSMGQILCFIMIIVGSLMAVFSLVRKKASKNSLF